jgi:predicted aldo/keto reductase-like oxidoreductase
MDRFLCEQLRRLGSEQIDYYLVHNLGGPMWERLKSLGVTDFLDRARADGRILNTGFSFHGKVQDFRGIVDDYPWEVCQIQYNYLDEEYQAGTAGLRYAAERGLGVIVMEPLRGGGLGNPVAPPEVDLLWKQAPASRTPAGWALSWVWNHPEVTAVLSGMNDEAHIAENIAAAEIGLPGALTPGELALVRRAGETYRRLMKVGCTGCEYCRPCPSGVHIPGCFEVLNRYGLYGNLEEARFLYAVRTSGILSTGEPGFASQCVGCGECLDKCPQSIPIPEILETVARTFEDEGLTGRVAAARRMLGIP